MDNKNHNPSANVPEQQADEPLGDRGKGDKTWSPGEGEQGISNRLGDEASQTAADEVDEEDSEEEEEPTTLG